MAPHKANRGKEEEEEREREETFRKTIHPAFELDDATGDHTIGTFLRLIAHRVIGTECQHLLYGHRRGCNDEPTGVVEFCRSQTQRALSLGQNHVRRIPSVESFANGRNLDVGAICHNDSHSQGNQTEME